MKRAAFLISIFAAGATLSGCAMGYVVETYSAQNRTFFDPGDGKTWWIYDRPDLNRMMVNAPLGDAAVSGATLGLIEPQYATFLSTGRDFLASTGRSCALDDGREILSNQVEFNYACGDAK